VQLKSAKRIVILACGTSWHASLIGKYLIESLANIPVEVDYASEYRYRNPIINEGDVVFAVSQSGETADTLEAIRLAKSKGALVLGICNVVGSSIARETVAGVYTHAGPEIGVASTKAFTTQISTLAMIALRLGKLHESVTDEQFIRLLTEISRIPELVETAVKLDAAIYEIAAKYKDAASYLFMGRGYNFPVALEGALKLKEISYIHAEGYPSGEMKHGPIALIDEIMPVVFITPKDLYYEKNMSNMQEVKARKGNIIAIATQGDEEVSSIADHVLYIPETEPLLTPLLTVVPLQILAYHTAVLRGCNVDQPRNLAKSVTVE
ncbi:MAG: glutamine--fructose-6-phosphate transaminase (isomerizing), partial [Candidatus Dojkabacteria bacterium]